MEVEEAVEGGGAEVKGGEGITLLVVGGGGRQQRACARDLPSARPPPDGCREVVGGHLQPFGQCVAVLCYVPSQIWVTPSPFLLRTVSVGHC